MARWESASVSVSRCAAASGGDDAGCTVVWVGGEHDFTTKAAVALAIGRAAQLEDGHLVVDLSAVTFMDASTVGALVWSLNLARSGSQAVVLRAPSAPALRVLELCGLGHLVERARATVHPTGPAAALGTWVDVPSSQLRDEADGDGDGVGTRSEISHPTALATADATYG